MHVSNLSWLNLPVFFLTSNQLPGNQWDFSNEGVLYLRSQINALEKKKYKIDAVGVDIKDYFEHCIRAARLYILKETDDTLPAARRHMKM